jgi:hypothetical protein
LRPARLWPAPPNSPPCPREEVNPVFFLISRLIKWIKSRRQPGQPGQPGQGNQPD